MDVMDENTNTFICKICEKVFTQNKNLKRHILNFHSFMQLKYVCHNCSKSYSNKGNLVKHISKCNNDKRKLKIIECLLCNNYKNSKANLLGHYSSLHNIDVGLKKMTFSNFEEFETWKDNKEKKDVSRYVRLDSKKTSNKTIYYYKCSRDGFYKCEGKNIRNLKLLGSNKINGYCPSKITATVYKNKKEVSVEFISAHVGHSMDLKRLSLKKSERNLLASKINQKIPFDELINEVKSSTLETCDRLHLLKRKDLYNIAQQYNLNSEPIKYAEEGKQDGQTIEEAFKWPLDSNETFIITVEEEVETNNSISDQGSSMQNEVARIPHSTKNVADLKQYKAKISAKLQSLLHFADTIEKCRIIENTLDSIGAPLSTTDFDYLR